MRVGNEIRTTIWTLLALQLLTAAGAIVLFSRMAPAIQQILEENVASLAAVQRMQRALAAPAADRDRAERFARALAEAEGNVTETEERPVLRRLRAASGAALRGDPAAVRQSLAALERIATINLAAMRRSDERASRLGEAGAWAMAELGMLCFVVGLVAVRRVARRVTIPLTRIHQTLAASKGGDARRRCALGEAALEASEIAAAVDELLDRQQQRPVETAGRQLHAALLALLDARARPTLVLSRAGEVLAANDAALERLGRRPGLREQLLAQLSDGVDAPDRAEVLARREDFWVIQTD